MKELVSTVRQTAYDLHIYFRHGHLEKVYENGLAHRLRKQSLTVEQQTAIQVTDEDGTILGNFIADLYVENRLIVELKACKALAGEHIAQVLGYLRASGKKHGLLINFGAPVFEIKKLIL
ncbi:GxxExxY protein [Akkermansiaceae bacterium]|nr:GxxExxY protein [Akkermansiaceae bacterium]MDA7936080.1 GxxExxY protein [bacterium]MDC1205964.1 GxxExxY protein [Akkermansiaceae bacterium]